MKKVIKVVCYGLLALALFSFTGCDSLIGGKDKNPDDTTQDDGADDSKKDDSKKDDSKKDAKGEKDFKARLESFGFKVDSYETNRPGVDAEWEPLEGDYEIPTLSGKNPVYSDNLVTDSSRSANSNAIGNFSSSLFSRMKMTELYVCGSGGTAQYDGLFSYEGNAVNQVESFTPSEYMTNTIVKTKAFDIDGDAHEDILIASFDKTNQKITLYARFYDVSKNAFSAEATLWEEANDHVGGIIVSTDKQGFDCCDFIVGDFDGDHKKEYALSLSYSVNGYGVADIYILDDYNAKCKVLNKYQETETFAKIKKNESSKVFKFASADIDGDGIDEIYAAIGSNGKGNQGYYKVYKYEASGLKTLACDKLNNDAKYNSLCTAIVDIGDIDGDGQMEIVFEGRQQDYYNCKVMVYKYDSEKKEYYWFASSPAGGFESNEKPYMPMAVGDVDQDGIEEIVWRDVVLRYNSKLASGDKIDSSGIGGNLPCEAGNGSITIGDFNYDGINDIAQVNWDGSKLYFTSYDPGTKSLVSSPAFDIQRANSQNESPVSICALAAKKGVARFSFKEHLLQFTEPDVIALVAAPLYFSEEYNGGIPAEEFQPSFGNQGTSIASSTSTSSSVDHSFTVTSSASAGFVWKEPTGFINLEAKIGVTLEDTYEHTWGESTSKQIEVSYTTHDKDMVVVKVTPMDVYVYEIASLPGAKEFEKREYIISLPRASYVKVCEVDFYESHKAKDAPSVKALFTHQVGNPYSYDNYETVQGKINAAKSVKCTNPDSNKVSGGDSFLISKEMMQGLPQGSTETTISFSEDKEKYEGNGYNIEAGIEAEVEIEFVYATFGLSFGGGDTWTTTIGSGSSIEGTVVGIDEKYADDYSFQWGIVSYPVAVDGLYFVPMVTYAVEK